MRMEEDAFAEVSRTRTCHNLVRVFHLEERSKRFQVSLPDGTDADPRDISRVAVIGAGVMGRGIAHVAARSGYRTILTDLS